MCTYQSICNEEGTQKKIFKFQVRIEKKHFQDDYMFGMRQLNGLKLSQNILKYVNVLPARGPTVFKRLMFLSIGDTLEFGHWCVHMNRVTECAYEAAAWRSGKLNSI